MREEIAAQVGDDALAERDDQVVAARRCRARGRRRATISARKVRLTKPASLPEKPTSIMRRMASGIGERRERRDNERRERGQRAPSVAGDIRRRIG